MKSEHFQRHNIILILYQGILEMTLAQFCMSFCYIAGVEESKIGGSSIACSNLIFFHGNV